MQVAALAGLRCPSQKKAGPQGEVTAIDIQEGMLHEVKKRALTANLDNIRFLRIGIEEGKLEQNYFDRAVMITVLDEIPDRETAVQEIFGALKSGGSCP
jgi:ubiquinone/menaquinone biosynthesis C-methylase UbiE